MSKNRGWTLFRIIIEYAFNLHSTFSSIRKIYLIVNNIWSEESTAMIELIVNISVVGQFNSELNCIAYFDLIKKND